MVAGSNRNCGRSLGSQASAVGRQPEVQKLVCECGREGMVACLQMIVGRLRSLYLGWQTRVSTDCSLKHAWAGDAARICQRRIRLIGARAVRDDETAVRRSTSVQCLDWSCCLRKHTAMLELEECANGVDKLALSSCLSQSRDGEGVAEQLGSRQGKPVRQTK